MQIEIKQFEINSIEIRKANIKDELIIETEIIQREQEYIDLTAVQTSDLNDLDKSLNDNTREQIKCTRRPKTT